MSDTYGMSYDPIQGQGQGQGHVTLKVGNSSIFKNQARRVVCLPSTGLIFWS